MFLAHVPDFLNTTGFAAFRLDPNGAPEYVEMTRFIESVSGLKTKFMRMQ
jgi:hypothetical protein